MRSTMKADKRRHDGVLTEAIKLAEALSRGACVPFFALHWQRWIKQAVNDGIITWKQIGYTQADIQRFVAHIQKHSRALNAVFDGAFRVAEMAQENEQIAQRAVFHDPAKLG